MNIDLISPWIFSVILISNLVVAYIVNIIDDRSNNNWNIKYKTIAVISFLVIGASFSFLYEMIKNYDTTEKLGELDRKIISVDRTISDLETKTNEIITSSSDDISEKMRVITNSLSTDLSKKTKDIVGLSSKDLKKELTGQVKIFEENLKFEIQYFESKFLENLKNQINNLSNNLEDKTNQIKTSFEESSTKLEKSNTKLEKSNTNIETNLEKLDSKLKPIQDFVLKSELVPVFVERKIEKGKCEPEENDDFCIKILRVGDDRDAVKITAINKNHNNSRIIKDPVFTSAGSSLSFNYHKARYHIFIDDAWGQARLNGQQMEGKEYAIISLYKQELYIRKD